MLETAGLSHMQSGPQRVRTHSGSGAPGDGDADLLSSLQHLQGGKQQVLTLNSAPVAFVSGGI